MVQLSLFKKSWLETAVSGKGLEHAHLAAMLTPDFIALVKESRYEPHKFAVLEICASLHAYAPLLIESFVDMAAKLVKFNMLDQLMLKLDQFWRQGFNAAALPEIFPVDAELARRREALQQQISAMDRARDCLARLRVAPARESLAVCE